MSHSQIGAGGREQNHWAWGSVCEGGPFVQNPKSKAQPNFFFLKRYVYGASDACTHTRTRSIPVPVLTVPTRYPFFFQFLVPIPGKYGAGFEADY